MTQRTLARGLMWARRLGIGVAVVAVGLLLWGFLVEPRSIDTVREVAVIPHLPVAWEGQRIALLADFQIGMWGANTGTIQRIVGQLIDRPPAAVLIAGDFLYEADDGLAEDIAEAVALVQPLVAAGIPTYAVLGNHDYSMDERDDPKDAAMAERLRGALERAGVRVLQNVSLPLPLPAERGRGITGGASDASATPLYIVGIGSHWAGEDDPAAALARVPVSAPRLVFMHNPDTFARLPAGAAPVTLAAHTHGGQVRLPFLPHWSWLTFMHDDAVHADGWIRDRDFGAPGNTLYVNRGIGFSDVPIRINCPPELTLFTLRPGAAPQPR